MTTKRKRWQSRIAIILAGVALGFMARFVWPPVVEDLRPSRTFSQPAREIPISELPIIPIDEEDLFQID